MVVGRGGGGCDVCLRPGFIIVVYSLVGGCCL